ncbi:MAG: hypothetical protein ACPGU1_06445 [Myxococcota bacterium]
MVSFEDALRTLGIEKSAGPKGAKEAYDAMSGPGLSPSIRKRLDAAYDLLQDPKVWQGGGAPVEVGVAAGADATPFATVRTTPDVASALERLGREHGDVFELGDLAAALDAGAPDGAAAVVRPLLQKGQIAAGADILRVLLTLMVRFKTVDWLKPRTAVRLVLVAYGSDTEGKHLPTIGRAVSALEEWKTAVGEVRFGYEGAAARGLKWAKELSRLPEGVHKTIRLALAQAAARGDLNRARVDIERFVSKDASSAAESAKLMDRRHDITRAVYDLFPNPALVDEKRSLPDFELATWAKIGLVVCILAVAANLVFGGEKDSDPTTIQLQHARDQICRTLNEESAACAFTGIIQQNLAEGRCGSVDRLLKELQFELKDYHDRRGGIVVGDAQEGVSVAEKVLIAIHATRCPAKGQSEEDAPPP